MSTTYYGDNWYKAIRHLRWFINEVKNEQECIKVGMFDEPLSGFDGFWYGMVKDFELDATDEEALRYAIAVANPNSLLNVTKLYAYEDADTLIKALENTIDFILNNKINCNVDTLPS